MTKQPLCWSVSWIRLFAIMLLLSLTNRLTRAYLFSANGSKTIRRRPFATSTSTTGSNSRLLLSSQSSQSSSSAAAAAKWQVGDLVSLPIQDGQADVVQQGVVREVRGAGWYSVQVNGSDSTNKYRGSRLGSVLASDSGGGDSTRVVVENLNKAQPPNRSSSQECPKRPPPPTIVNLDAAVQSLATDCPDAIQNVTDRAYLQQVAHHLSFQKWVVFTDLHCSPSTLDTTLQVLEQVHQEAIQRNAGVLFLGDWWHHRGTLRVDCLNSVLSHLKTWTVPMVLIPGNHDQVTLGGHNHGLTPLENAFRVAVGPERGVEIQGDSVPGPLVFSHPTMFANGLFVPHIRDHAVMESVLQSDSADKAAAVFVHADVTGAYMNDQIVSLGGVSPKWFPPNKPIYSGHFHKPHVIKSGNVSIEYLGSPYEVSLAEAQQPKALVVLDASDGWKCIERIPISVGRKHFRALSLQDFLAFQPAVTAGENDTATTLVDMEQPPIVNAGDRVVLSMDANELDEMRRSVEHGSDSTVDAHAKALRQAGALVEIREVKELPSEPMGVGGAKDASELEELSVESTWKAYIAEETRREALSSANAEALLQSGLDMLEELDAGEDFQPDQSRNMTDLKLGSVTLEGFGPFQESTTYPLLDRGLVLLRGSNKDGGSDSNGSGKSSLAMATLWALTGSVDPRPLQDSKVSDVVNDSCKAARVSVKGSLNGVDFSILRTKTLSKGSLAFFLGGHDLTTQSAKETQAVIDEKLGVSAQVLARTMFHGQHALNELLDATDSKLKDELSLVVPLSLWQSAVAVARKKGRTASKKASELDGMYSVRSDDLEKLQNRLGAAEAELVKRETCFREIEAEMLAELEVLRDSEGLPSSAVGETLDSIEERLLHATESLAALEIDQRSRSEQRAAEVATSKEALNEASAFVDTSRSRFQLVQREYDGLAAKVDMAKERIDRLEATWRIDLSSGKLDDLSMPATCPTCQQPLSSSSDKHLHEDIQQSMRQDVAAATEWLEVSGSSLAEKREELDAIESSRTEDEMRLGRVREEHEGVLTHWENMVADVESQLVDARMAQQTASKDFTAQAKQMQHSVKANSLESSINAERETLRVAERVVEDLRGDLESCESLLTGIQARKDEQASISTTMGKLSDAYGQRGVQTFVMQNAVSLLESLSQSYLDELSDGAQRLELTLDAGDRLSRRAFVRGGEGEYRERPLASLSGGQWRRCSLSLTLGFADLVSRRGGLQPSLCVLDEPLTHLDRSGRSDVGRVLRRLLRRSSEGHESNGGFSVSTILIILQDLAAEELEESFDCIDEVVKSNGSSSVLVDEQV